VRFQSLKREPKVQATSPTAAVGTASSFNLSSESPKFKHRQRSGQRDYRIVSISQARAHSSSHSSPPQTAPR